MSEQKHTPTPWSGSSDHISGEVRRDSDGALVAIVSGCRIGCIVPAAEIEANTAFIVRAVNAHDDLVKALEAASGYLLNAKIDLETGATKRTAIQTIDGGLKMIRSALSLAKGTTND